MSVSANITNGPTGTVTAQHGDSPAGEGVANLMDGISTTKFLTFHNTSWVQWKGAGTMGVGSYAIVSANDAPGRDPKSWTLLGSNDGTFWSTLDTRTGEAFTSRYQTKSYTIASPASFLYYRLDISAAADAALNKIQFAEWNLVGVVSAPTTQTLEAELATKSGPLFATRHTPFTGTGYLDFQHNSGDYVQFAFNLAAAGTGPLTFRYANGTSTTIKVRVTVNGTNLSSSLTMPATGGWGIWRTVSLSTPLKAGSNTVRITTINVGQPNIDHLKVTSASGTVPCTPTTVTPYISVNGGAPQQTNALTVSLGATVKLSPEPATGGTWSWTGPNGFVSTSREITLANIQSSQAGNYAATHTNATGCKFTQVFSLAVSTLTADWSTFVFPTVTFTNQATALEGSAIFLNAIPDVSQMMKEQCLAVVKELYSDNLDRRVNFTKLNLILADSPTGVAWKSGSPPEISISISAQYIANFYHQNGDNLTLVNKEVRGVLSHEGTHGYQWEPKNCGAYDGSSVFWSLIEGEADGVRAELTNWTPARAPSKGGDWMGGYARTGFFLSWCKRNKKPTFLIELNHAARDMPTFTWDGAFQQILGIGVQQAWNEYQASLP